MKSSRSAVPSSYGLQPASGGKGLLPWSWAEERLTAARNYWICSAGDDGRPHAMPVWGLWLEGGLLFGTARTSRKGRNLRRNPAVVVHLESGDEVVILEGQGRPGRRASSAGGLPPGARSEVRLPSGHRQPGRPHVPGSAGEGLRLDRNRVSRYGHALAALRPGIPGLRPGPVAARGEEPTAPGQPTAAGSRTG